MSILNIIRELQSTAGTNAKIDILKNLIGTDQEELFKKVCIYTLDGRINYWMTSFEDPNVCTGSNKLEDLFDTLDTIARRDVTGHEAKSLLESELQFLEPSDVDVARLIIERDLGCGVGAKTINKVWPDLIYIHPYMRCSSFSEKNLKNIKFPAYSQTKADGSYTDIVVDVDNQTVTYQSRTGEYKNYGTEEMKNQILKETHQLPWKRFVLQGEALVLDKDGNILPRETGNGILNSNNCQENHIMFQIWDIVPYSVWTKDSLFGETKSDPYNKRFAILDTFLTLTNSSHFQLTETVVVNNVDEVFDHFLKNIERGLEGTVLKDYCGDWNSNTSKWQVKVKIIAEAEFKIVDALEGTNKYTGMLGAFVVETADGLLRTRVGTGLTDKQREQFWDNREMLLGSVVTVRFNNVVKNQDEDSLFSLFLPRFIEIRKDKTEADTLVRVNEQLASTKDILELMSKE